MSDQCLDTLRCDPGDLTQAMSIHTRKITDSCRDKDCIEDLQVYLTTSSQSVLDTASGAKVRCAELLYTAIEVEPVSFDRNHYCIDATFYYQILADATVGNNRPVTLYGLAVFSKRAVLCGEDSHAHIFRSNTLIGNNDGPSLRSSNRPTAVVEVLDPMILSSCVRDVCHCPGGNLIQIPGFIRQMFDEDLVITGEQRKLFVTLGQFSILRLERDAQLIVPVLDYAIPTKECCDAPGGCAEDPCEMFSRIPFPSGQFAPTGCDGKQHDQDTCCSEG